MYSSRSQTLYVTAAAPALTRLELRDNGLHGSIEGLEGLSALESLDLQGNRIEKIGSGLALCANLTYLDLSYNALSFKKPEALSAEYLPNLKELFLAQNQIKTWRGLGAVAPSLTQLDVGNNRLKVIGPELGRLVEMLPALQTYAQQLLNENERLRDEVTALRAKLPPDA